MRTFRGRLMASSFIVGALALAGAAYAQDETQETLPTTPAPAQDTTEVEGLVVTGSRIPTTEFTSSSPIQIVSTEDAPLQGVADVGQLLQQSSVAAGSPQINTLISSAFVTDGGPGAQTLSLRGLGANRTLVLLNGRRAGPAGTRGGVSAFDLNVIPLSVIDRVEILKDGASSIYGSDAVAGVVNIITRRDRDGFDADAFASQPFENGGEEYRVSLSWGRRFSNGHFGISFDWYQQRELRRRDRDYLNCSEQYIFDPQTGERKDIVDATTGRFACRDTLWGQLWLYDRDNDINGVPGARFSPDSSFLPGRSPVPRILLQFDNTGQLLAHSPGSAPPAPRDPGDLIVPPGWFVVESPNDLRTFTVTNYDHPFIGASSVIPEINRYSVYAEGAVDVGGDMELYSEVLLNRRESRTHGFRQFWNYQFTQDWIFNYDYSPDFADPVHSAGFSGPWYFSPTGISDHQDASQRVDYGRVVFGLRGRVAGDWRWDIFGQFSRSDGDYTQDVILQDAVDSQTFRQNAGLEIFGAPFMPESCVGTTLPVSGRPCIDINWLDPRFLAGDLNAAERAFLYDTETGNTTYGQAMIEGSIAGTAMQLPAGPLGVALGFQSRFDRIRDVPGSITLSGNSWGFSSAGITEGSDYTNEVFGELNIPLLRDAPFAHRINLQLSGRYTDVRAYGDNATYKVGLDWQFTDSFRFRGTYGTSFRAPALFELFLANETGFLPQRSVDPCINWGAALANGDITQALADNCAADGVPDDHDGSGSQVTISSSGGFGVLKAETSTAYTLGLVWTPHFADLSIALDYFDIEVKNEVTRLGGNNVVLGCYESEFFPTDGLCARFDRDPTTHLINTVTDDFINISDQRNRGLDLTIRYHREMPWFDFTINGQATYQIEDTIALFPGAVIDANGDVGEPRFVANSAMQFRRGNWTLFYGLDFIGPSSDEDDCPSASCLGEDIAANQSAFGPYRAVIDTPWVVYHSLSLQWRADDWNIILGVANVFDEHPPRVTTITSQGNFNTVGQVVLSSQYDYYDRRGFVSLRRNF